MEDGGEIYAKSIRPDQVRVVEKLTEGSHWDFEQFKKVMVALAAVGHGQSVPAHHRPESLHLQGLRPMIDGLKQRTVKTRLEHAQPVFADVGNGALVFGRVTPGK